MTQYDEISYYQGQFNNGKIQGTGYFFDGIKEEKVNFEDDKDTLGKIGGAEIKI